VIQKKSQNLSQQESGEEDGTPVPHKIPYIERVRNKDLSKVLLFMLTLCSPKIILSAEDMKEPGEREGLSGTLLSTNAGAKSQTLRKT